MTHPFNVRQDGEIEVLLIENDHCTAELTLFGGHLMQWQPKGQKPVFWMSDNSAQDAINAIRGGIPICWPWFGEVQGQGKHGLARTLPWSLDNVEHSNEETRIELSINFTSTQNPWGYPNRCKQTLVIGKTLTQELVIDQAENDTQFTFALHNYFAVSSPANIVLPFIEGVPFFDKVNTLNSEGETGQPDYSGPIDRVYHTGNTAELIDTEWQRKIIVEKQNSADTVVWNPGKDAAGIADIHRGGEKEYLCMEAAGTQPVTLAKAQTVTIAQTIKIETL